MYLLENKLEFKNVELSITITLRHYKFLQTNLKSNLEEREISKSRQFLKGLKVRLFY